MFTSSTFILSRNIVKFISANEFISIMSRKSLIKNLLRKYEGNFLSLVFLFRLIIIGNVPYAIFYR